MDNIAKVSGVIRSYQNEIDSFNRLKISVELRQKELRLEKESIIESIKSSGFSSKDEVQKQYDLYKSMLSANLSSLKYALNDLKMARESLRGEKKAYTEIIKEKESKIKSLHDQQVLVCSVADFLRVTSDTVRQNSINKIEDLVSNAINKIFEFNPPLKFKMEIVMKSGSSSINFIIEDPKNGFSSSILDSYGGGVGDVVGVVLRLVILEFQVPKNTAPVVFDEVGKFISSDHQRRFSEFLKDWANTFNRQIIMVTHRPEVIEYADKVFRIYKEGDTSIINEVINEKS